MAPDDRRPAAPASEAVSRRFSRTRGRDTKPELALRRALHARGLRFYVDRAPLRGIRRRADIVFPRLRLAVYVDGCFFHGCPLHMTWPARNADFWREKIERNIERDSDTDARMEAAGWTVVRVWEHRDPAEVSAEIAALVLDLRSRRPPRCAEDQRRRIL